MKINLDDLHVGEEKEYQWDIPVSWLENALSENIEDDHLEASLFFATEPVILSVWAHRNAQEVFFQASMQGMIGIRCGRCLQKNTLPLDIQFSGVFHPVDSTNINATDDPSCFFYDLEKIDFSSAVHEYLFLHLPLNPLCPDNECEVTSSSFVEGETRVDPRWDALRQIRNKQCIKSNGTK